LPDVFLIRNGLKQEHDLLPFHSSALDYAIRKFRGNEEALILNRTSQFLVYADVNFTVKNTNTIKKNTETVLDCTSGLHKFYSSPNILRMMKLKRLRWAGHIVRMEAIRIANKCLVEKLEGRSPL
jgi:hypothetical protein